MALDPLTIQKEREKIDQVKVTGVVEKSNLVEHTECIDTYSATVDTGEEKINFKYLVLSGKCTTDSIYDIVEKPFEENSTVHISISREDPHEMVYGNILFSPAPFSSFPAIYIICGVLFLIAGMVVGAWLKTKK